MDEGDAHRSLFREHVPEVVDVFTQMVAAVLSYATQTVGNMWLATLFGDTCFSYHFLSVPSN